MERSRLMRAIAMAAAFAVAATGALAQSGSMTGVDRKSMTKERSAQSPHRALGTVKSVDAKAGTAMIAHEPVQSLKWPAMTMSFKVADPALLTRLGPGKKIEFDFEQRGRDYVITGVR
jgi:Cu(I)/Ag(I) efflux system periplasmic protein CusF